MRYPEVVTKKAPQPRKANGLKTTAFYASTKVVTSEAKVMMCGFQRFEEGNPRPELILLDLNMTGDGCGALSKLMENPDSRTVPVIVLTASTEPAEVRNAYQNCANTYLAKPHSIEEYVSLVKKLFAFWFEVTEIPKQPRSLPHPFQPPIRRFARNPVARPKCHLIRPVFKDNPKERGYIPIETGIDLEIFHRGDSI